ncbi:SMP-30/gluconolactonase/LRE family protein [Sandaracinobacteroides hominis]|uniref:SMP-30/gluconolactonase/LRE family protein n=1 Tax=Sandaracinobacteroides hominis TaxID=2780086 RepID=UPI0018F76849|nr:SMP-30/gluconolactonase/LRE family protein [Sandaracinobacteroides hominis]
MDFRILAEGLAFPEGPVMMDDGSIILVEIEAGRISRIAKDGKVSAVATPGGGPNGLAIGPDGALYVCNNGGFNWGRIDGMLIPGAAADNYETGRIERIDLSTGKVERLFDSYEGHRLSGPNDIVFDAAGGFWFTDLGKHFPHHTDHGGLYYVTPGGGQLKRAVYGPDMNGCGLSPDGKTVYTALTTRSHILAFDITGPGEVAPSPLAAIPGRVVADFPGRTLLDSMAVLASGKIAQATLVENPGIGVADPATGEIVFHAFPDLLTTNIAFGGADMCDAAICLSTTGKLALARWPEPGLRLNYNA